jgi:hypothetical protein
MPKNIRLAISFPSSQAAGRHSASLSKVSFAVADAAPRVVGPQSSILFPFQESHLQGPFSRISEIQAQPHDPGRAAQSRELNFKLKKVHGKIETTAAGLGTMLKDSMDQVGRQCQSAKGFANEQAKAITQITLNFQQQSGQLSRTFQNAVGDVETSFRAALSFMSSLRQFPAVAPHAPAYPLTPVYPAPDPTPHAARPKRIQRRSEPETLEEGEGNEKESGVENSLRKWRREAKKSRADRTRITQQFRQLKQKIPDD